MNWSDHLTGAEALYGDQTARALISFDHGGARIGDFPGLVRALAMVKIAAARANRAVGVISPAIAEAIECAGREVMAGRHDRQFVLPVLQGGGGTSTHMNANEVIAALATAALDAEGLNGAVHPNDHVNAGQSTNDVMPTAIAVAVRTANEELDAGLAALIETLRTQAADHPELDHLGRSCLQDAVAIPVSSVHRTHAWAIEQALVALRRTTEDLLAVPLGATAVGTGVGAAPGFADRAIAELRELSALDVTAAALPTYGLSSLEPLVAVSEAVDRAARSVARVGSDLRLLASGPVGGIGEVELPALQAGSSIMPGKINPVLPEFVMQLSFRIAGAATSARMAAAAGELEVSAMAPVVTVGILEGMRDLAAATRSFADRCIAGLRWNREAIAANLCGSFDQAVVAAQTEGYDRAAARRSAGTSRSAGTRRSDGSHTSGPPHDLAPTPDTK